MLRKKLILNKTHKKILPFLISELNVNLDINIVVSRYNEDLNWINTEPYNKYFIICYNKGNNNNFTIKSPHKIINLENVGKCDHTYLYYIINNYEKLPEYIIFLPGSSDKHYKNLKSKLLINYIEYYKKLVNIGTILDSNIKNHFYNFECNEYKTTNNYNYKLNSEINTYPSKIKPFGKWYEYHFGENNVNFHTWWGIFAITRDIIYQHQKEYYQKFLY